MFCVVERVPGVRKMNTAVWLVSASKTRSPEVTGERTREMAYFICRDEVESNSTSTQRFEGAREWNSLCIERFEI